VSDLRNLPKYVASPNTRVADPSLRKQREFHTLPRRPRSLPPDGIPRVQYRFFLESAAGRKQAARYSVPPKVGHS